METKADVRRTIGKVGGEQRESQDVKKFALQSLVVYIFSQPAKQQASKRRDETRRERSFYFTFLKGNTPGKRDDERAARRW